MLEKIAAHYQEIIASLGEDPGREGLADRPVRAAKAMQFLTQGYEQNIKDVVNGAIFESDSDQMVILKDIELYSLCEHHILPFFGKVHVAYLPKGRVIGLSKIPRIVDVFARRLQIQENLTDQIAQCIQEVTGAEGVAVVGGILSAARRVHACAARLILHWMRLYVRAPEVEITTSPRSQTTV